MKKIFLMMIAGTLFLTACGNSQATVNTNVENEQLTEEQLLNLLQNSNTEIELQIEVPEDVEQGTQAEITWGELTFYNSYEETLRKPMEDLLGITYDANANSKVGMIYELDNRIIPNNTLMTALQNKDFREAVANKDTISKISEMASNTFVDLDADDTATNLYMAINAYFNLLPATEENYANPQNVLTRAQAMALIMRAETPYSASLKVDEDFEALVGQSEYNLYAQKLHEDNYLASDNSLTQSYNTNMSRGEFIYMLMNHYFADELADIDTTGIELEDVEDGGDIAAKNGFTTGYAKNHELTYAFENPSEAPSDIYKALVLANQKGIIEGETSWEEGITLEDAIEMLMDLYTLEEDTEVSDSSTTKPQKGDVFYDEETGEYLEYGYDYEMSNWEILNDEDHIAGGTVMYNEDGTTYILWEAGAEAGTIYHMGDTLPDDTYYSPITEADEIAYEQMLRELFGME